MLECLKEYHVYDVKLSISRLAPACLRKKISRLAFLHKEYIDNYRREIMDVFLQTLEEWDI